MQLELAIASHLLVLGIACFKCRAVKIMQVRGIVGRKQGPISVLEDPLHEQIGNPVRRVHVVSTTSVIPCILAQIQKLLDIHMPGLKVGTHGALALAALIHGYSGVVHHFQEWHQTLALAVRALDVGPHGAYGGPVVAQAASKL